MKLCSRPTLHTRRTPTRLAFADHMGDREKPGAERATKLILVYYVPPQTLSSWHPTLGTEAEAMQSSPRFFPVSYRGGQLVVEYATVCFRSQEDYGPV